MKIDIIDVDEFVKINNLKEVTSGVILQRGNVPHPDGLLSNEIFGITVKSRRETFAYIDLHGHFFHPHIYKVVHSMFRNIDKIINGEKFYSLNEEGILVEDKVNGETGLEFIYKNWEKITWKKSGDNDTAVGIRSERVGLLEKCKKSEIFMTKMIVIPVFYRDVTNTSKGGETGELNKYYSNLIRLTTLLQERELFAIEFNATRYNIQQQIMNIYNYFKVKVQKKNGMIRRYLLGKTVDNATRVVITAPSFHAERPSDLMVDYTHASVPLSQCCALVYPFMMQWIKEFFNNEVISKELTKIVYDPTGKVETQTLRLKDPTLYFDESYIKNMMDSYIRDSTSRFNRIEVPVEGATQKYYMKFTGRKIKGKEELSSIMYRSMTVTDILYMAAVAVTEDKVLMTTRYPMRDEFSIINNHIRVNSTTKTEPMMVGETIYRWYPVVEPNTPANEMASKFIDSLQFSESHLEGIQGDYDGDQVTTKILYSQEANEELKKYLHSPAAFISAAGDMYKPIGSEATQTFYTFTKEPPSNSKGVALDTAKQKELLAMKVEDFTFSRMVEMFGTTFDTTTNKQKNPEYNMYATIKVPKDHFYNSSEITTTVGRYVWYLQLMVGSNVHHVVPFQNIPITQKKLEACEHMICRAVQESKVKTAELETYISVRDWFGMQMHGVVCTSITPGTLFMPATLDKKKKEILKAHEKELATGNPAVAEQVENEMKKVARDLIGEDPGMDLFDSGARGSFDNNYKNMYLIRGPVYNEATKKYDFIPNSLMDGLDKSTISAHANTLVNGAYPKSIGTADSGYLGKQLNAIMQSIVLNDDKESDCGTKLTLDIVLPEGSIHDYDYRFIVENNKLVCLTPDIIEQYAGKRVKLRSVMFCKDPYCKCSRCAGLYYYKIGKKYVGLQSQKAATRITDMNMEKFHSNVVKTAKIDASDLIL